MGGDESFEKSWRVQFLIVSIETLQKGWVGMGHGFGKFGDQSDKFSLTHFGGRGRREEWD